MVSHYKHVNIYIYISKGLTEEDIYELASDCTATVHEFNKTFTIWATFPSFILGKLHKLKKIRITIIIRSSNNIGISWNWTRGQTHQWSLDQWQWWFENLIACWGGTWKAGFGPLIFYVLWDAVTAVWVVALVFSEPGFWG